MPEYSDWLVPDKRQWYYFKDVLMEPGNHAGESRRHRTDISVDEKWWKPENH